MKIAFFECKPEEKAFFEEKLPKDELFFFENTINEVVDEVQEYEVISVFVHSEIDESLLDNLPKLKYIQTRSSGYEHIMCKQMYKSGLVLSNVSGYAGPAVAEFSFSLLLNATRHTNISLQRTKENNFEYSDLKGIELFGKTIGILGLGTIGMQMARIAHGFGMKTVVYSRTHKPIVDELGIEFVALKDLLQNADILMFALPLTPETESIINGDNAKLIKEDAVIVNAARAGLIQQELYNTLPNIFCLDMIDDLSLLEKENINYTPHMAYYTKEALLRILETSYKNIAAYQQGDKLPNCLYLECEKNYNN